MNIQNKDLREIIFEHFGDQEMPNDLYEFYKKLDERFLSYERHIDFLKAGDSFNRFRQISQKAPYAGLIIEKSSSKILLFNAKILENTQYSKEEIQGMRLTELFESPQPESATVSYEELQEIVSNHDDKDGKVYECLFKRKDGSPMWVETSFVVMPAPENSFSAVILRDINKEKLDAEKNKELMKKLEQVNKELQEFAYVVSHDLKAPLRGISSITTWLVKDFQNKLGEEGAEMLQLLENRTVRMQQLIDGVLAYSKVDHEGEAKQWIDTLAMVEELVEILDPPASIEFEIDNQLPQILFEPTKLSQIFQNLLSNAIKFMDKEKGLIQVRGKDKGDVWELSVSDNGPGIEKTYHDKIFQVFQSLHSRDEIESTGIGLSIVKKVMENYGGKIWIESTIGEGCTFYLHFPKSSRVK